MYSTRVWKKTGRTCSVWSKFCVCNNGYRSSLFPKPHHWTEFIEESPFSIRLTYLPTHPSTVPYSDETILETMSPGISCLASPATPPPQTLWRNLPSHKRKLRKRQRAVGSLLRGFPASYFPPILPLGEGGRNGRAYQSCRFARF